MIQIDRVADYLIAALHESGEEISNLKLQKLLYFAQGLYLAQAGEPLFDEDIQSWKNGPVSPDVYQRFKKFEWHDIDDPTIEKPKGLPDEMTLHLDLIVESLGGLSAIELMKMSHKTDPWLEAWSESRDDIYPGAVISKSSMRKFFSKVENDIMSAMCQRIETEDAADPEEDLTLDQVRRMREHA